jgi:serine/threonine protein kinase
MNLDRPFAEVTLPLAHDVSSLGALSFELRLGHGRLLETFAGYRTQAGRSRPVVIKRLRTELAGNRALAEALVAWATQAKGLEHPYLVRVEAGELRADGALVVTEQVEGQSLTQLIGLLRKRRRSWTPAMALAVIEPVARALAFLHLRHRVHGDLDASDVLIRADGVVKVSDAGLYALGVQAGTDLLASVDTIPTPATPAGDVYALGLLLLELLLGHAPWRSGRMSVRDAIAAVADFTGFAQAEPALALRLTNLLEGCLETEPQRRIGAAEIIAAIDHIVDAHDFELDAEAVMSIVAAAALRVDESESPTRMIDPERVAEARRQAILARQQRIEPLSTSRGSRLSVIRMVDPATRGA